MIGHTGYVDECRALSNLSGFYYTGLHHQVHTANMHVKLAAVCCTSMPVLGGLWFGRLRGITLEVLLEVGGGASGMVGWVLNSVLCGVGFGCQLHLSALLTVIARTCISNAVYKW